MGVGDNLSFSVLDTPLLKTRSFTRLWYDVSSHPPRKNRQQYKILPGARALGRICTSRGLGPGICALHGVPTVWSMVGSFVGSAIGEAVGSGIGDAVGAGMGTAVGPNVGAYVAGDAVGAELIVGS